MVVETVGLFVVYGNVFYSFPKQELLAHPVFRFLFNIAALFFPTGLDLNTLSRLTFSIPCVRKSEKSTTDESALIN